MPAQGVFGEDFSPFPQAGGPFHRRHDVRHHGREGARGVALRVLRPKHGMTADGNPAIFATCTETPARSQRRIFTYRKTKIATSPFIYSSAPVFTPEKWLFGVFSGNLDHGML